MAEVASAQSSMGTQSTTRSEYMLGPELGAIIVDHYEGGFDEHGCYSGHGEALFRSGNTYSGEFRRGVMDGRGRYTWISDGTVYEGDLSNNELIGHGRFTWKNGSSYEGSVVGGLRNGHGTFISADGTLVYDGSWNMSKRHGYGEQRYGVGTEDVSSYAGEWHENCRHGRGTMTYASGNIYEGDWVEDRKEGRGTMNWVERRERYTGEWKHDLQCGYGEHVWIEERPVSSVSMDTQKQMCNVYRGEWLDGMRHGQGTFMYADGSRHQGQWHKNKKHGPAVFITDNGRTFEGLFQDDAMLGKIGQDDEHPELSASVKLKIIDILSPVDDAATAAVVREVERSALQINSDLKLLYKHYAKPGITAPRDSTMFTMSMEQFVALARDCRALAPSTPVTVGEVYRMFFRMRRQHAFELKTSMERAIKREDPHSSSNGRSSRRGSNGEGLAEKEDGDECGAADGPRDKQAFLKSPSEYEMEGIVESREQIYDSQRAITFREYVEGIVRLARIVYLQAGAGTSMDSILPLTAASQSTTPRSPALARIGTAPMEGGGTLSLPGGTFGNATHDGGGGASAAVGGISGQNEATHGSSRERAVESVNANFKQFVAKHLSGLLASLSGQAAFGGGGGDGRAGGKGGGRGGGSKGGAGRGKGGAVVARRGGGTTASSKRGEDEVNPAESPCVKELSRVEEQVSSLYCDYSGPLFAPMTLRSLLRMTIRDANLRQRAGITSKDVKQVFKEANAFLQSPDGPATPETSSSTSQIGAADGAIEAVGQGGKESVSGARLESAAVVGGGAGEGALPLPTVDLDLLDQELMPAEFKVVVAELYELARDKNTLPPTAAAAARAAARELDSYEPSSQQSPTPGEGEGSARTGKNPESSPRGNTAVPPPAATGVEQPTRSPEAFQDGGGSDSAKLGGDEEEGSGSKVVEAPPDWLADPKVFVARVLQWAQEGGAKRSRFVGAKPPKRVFPL